MEEVTLELNEEQKRKQEELLTKRHKYNRLLLQTLKKYMRNNPSFTFVQAIRVLSIISNTDNWHEEPDITYNRVMRTLDIQREMRDRLNGK